MLGAQLGAQLLPLLVQLLDGRVGRGALAHEGARALAEEVALLAQAAQQPRHLAHLRRLRRDGAVDRHRLEAQQLAAGDVELLVKLLVDAFLRAGGRLGLGAGALAQLGEHGAQRAGIDPLRHPVDVVPLGREAELVHLGGLLLLLRAAKAAARGLSGGR